jgi:hypothetical protein
MHHHRHEPAFGNDAVMSKNEKANELTQETAPDLELPKEQAENIKGGMPQGPPNMPQGPPSIASRPNPMGPPWKKK